MTKDNNHGITRTTFTEEQALSLLRHLVHEAGNQKKWLHKTKVGIGQTYLSEIVRGTRALSNDEVLKAIGLKRMVVYVEADEA